MMKPTLPVLLILIATPALAEGTRHADAHVHGISRLNIALDGNDAVMELHAPGADIVGFEYEASSETDLAAIATALETLEQPAALFTLPAAAGCELTHAHAALMAEADHDDHDTHNHDAHADHDEHEDDAHEDHDSHDHDDHDEHDHDDHGHDDHDDHAEDTQGHTEFHAEYRFTCADLDALNGIEFGYFTSFENAREIEVQVVTAHGAQAATITADALSFELDHMH